VAANALARHGRKKSEAEGDRTPRGVGDAKSVDASVILQRLYDSEINFKIFSEWDAGFFWKLGDSMNGYVASGDGSWTIAETADEVAKAAVRCYPDSTFAKW
jgi:hypothetical protein